MLFHSGHIFLSLYKTYYYIHTSICSEMDHALDHQSRQEITAHYKGIIYWEPLHER